MMKKIFYGILVIMAVTACTGNKVYDTYNHTPISGWEKNDTLLFDVPAMKNSGSYQEFLGLRINGAYPFVGLTLIIEQTKYPQNLTQIDTVNCQLINKNGTYKGQGVASIQYKFPISTLQLEKGDSLHICIRHDMKREILPGISEIGIECMKK
jgi:gliding motility-associated lipoprotein GldH